MLEEAVEVMRGLWEGAPVSHDGPHYTVENARLYTLPDEPPPSATSPASGPKAIVARRADRRRLRHHAAPSATLVEQYRSEGGGGKPVPAGRRSAGARTRPSARRTAHRLWPNEGLPGELAQVLPTPAHFEQAGELVTEEMIAESVPCGPDLDEHVEALQAYADAGFDELYVQQIGTRQEEFFAMLARDLLPRFDVMSDIRIGVQVQPQHASYDAMRRAWAEAEEIGADMVFTWDHFFPLSATRTDALREPRARRPRWPR